MPLRISIGVIAKFLGGVATSVAIFVGDGDKELTYTSRSIYFSFLHEDGHYE